MSDSYLKMRPDNSQHRDEETHRTEGEEQPDSGLRSGLDISDFVLWPGRSGLLRMVETHLDTDLRTFKLTVLASSGIDVTWK